MQDPAHSEPRSADADRIVDWMDWEDERPSAVGVEEPPKSGIRPTLDEWGWKFLWPDRK